MKLLVINGPNLNLLGLREPAHYGTENYTQLIEKIQAHCAEKQIEVTCYQSNHEGDLVDRVQQAYFEGMDGIVINPGAYTHTSIAILDAVKAVRIPTALMIQLWYSINYPAFLSLPKISCRIKRQLTLLYGESMVFVNRFH